jgi:hypothetical protein
MQRLPHDKLTTVTLPTKHGIQFDAPAEVAAAITAFAHGVGAPGEPHGRF